jgi:hypothetical protein
MIKKNNLKKSIAILTVLCMMFTLIPINAFATESTNDVSSHWAKQQITDWLSKGYVTGYADGSFKPNQSITRAEFMAMANKAFDYREQSEISFKDVNSKAWYYEAVASAKTAGYISGYPDGTMKPSAPITRAEAAVMIKAIKKLTDNTGETEKFSDKLIMASWAKGAIGAVVNASIMGGYPDGSFKGGNKITRAEAVVALDKALKAIEQTQVNQDVIYDKAGTYGPSTGTETIKGNVVIKVKDVILQNTIIEGTLTIDKAVGEGNVTLKKVNIQGNTYIYGGGMNSIYFIDTQTGKTYVMKDNGPVRIVAAGTTEISQLVAQSSVKVQEVDLTGKGFEGIVVDKKVNGKIEISLVDSKVDSLEIKSEGITVNADKNTEVKTLEVKATGVTVTTEKGTKVTTLVADAKMTVTGEGKIDTAKINASGVTLETKPTTTDTASGVSAPTITTPTTSGGGSGGSNSGGSTTVLVSAINVTSVADTLVSGGTLQMSAAITPTYATNKMITWSISDIVGKVKDATIDATGVLTGTGDGSVTVTATNVASGITGTKEIAVIIVNKTALTAAITAEVGANHGTPAYVLTSGDYTAISWTAYTNAVAAAILVEADANAVQTAIDSASAAIGTTKTALVFANKAAMDAAVIAANAKVQADYTAASWTQFASARTIALAMPAITNADMGAMTTALNAAIALLKIDKAAITAEVGANHGTPAYVLTAGDYTAISWTAYTNAVAAAILVEADANAVQTAIDSASAAIGTTKTALVFANKAAMDAAVIAANAKVQADYTAASWTQFASARTIALAMPAITNADMGAMTTALNAAIALLREAVPETLSSIAVINFNYSTLFATQARIESKAITTSNFNKSEGKNKVFNVTDSSGNTILIDLWWNIPALVNDQPATYATVVGSAVESYIQQYFVDKGGAALMNRTLWASGSGDKFSIGAFGVGPTGKITITGKDASYFFDTLEATGTNEDHSPNRTFTINDGTTIATIALDTSYTGISQLVSDINSMLTTSQASAVKINETQFKLVTKTKGIHLTIGGTNRSDFFSSFESQ